MRNIYKLSGLLIMVLGVFVLLPLRADAYIDPNTGGVFFNSVLPFIYGILAAIVLFWKRIIIFIKGKFSDKKKDDKE